MRLISSIAIILFIIASTIGCNDHIYIQGQRLYEYHCQNCHMGDGSGLEKVIPSIRESDYFDTKLDSLPCLIRHGRSEYMTSDSILLNMPVNYKLTEYEITNIINYLKVVWYEDEPIHINWTRELLEDCPLPTMRYGQ